MRKYVLVMILIILTIIGFLIVGFGIKPIKIYSYKQIELANKDRKALLAELNEKNVNEFEQVKKSLSTSVKNYQTKKAEYDALLETGDLTAESNIYNSSLYDIDFLMTTIGNYATQNGVTLQLDVSRSSTSTSVSSEYIICDLSFTITGDYIAITNFVYKIEDDDNLKFEINDFLMEKGGENLQATFLVKNVPVNSKNLSAIPSTSTNNVDVNNK